VEGAVSRHARILAEYAAEVVASHRQRRQPRAKDILREYLRTHKEAYTSDEAVPYLYDFVYWLEGQDLIEDDHWAECRYHVVPADQSTCPFDSGEADRTTEATNQ
jgi:hypothetical protein